jgi:hypothetical protein
MAGVRRALLEAVTRSADTDPSYAADFILDDLLAPGGGLVLVRRVSPVPRRVVGDAGTISQGRPPGCPFSFCVLCS